MQWSRHKKAKEKLKEIFDKEEDFRIIHYSCQSFNRIEAGKSAIISTIAVYSLHSDTIASFDIQTAAEKLRIDYSNIANPDNMKKIETDLLQDFFDYIKVDQRCVYLHWNMRDSQYGFQALNRRYSVLTGKNPEYVIPENKQINLAKLFEDYFGTNYVSDPKIKSIVELNPSLKPRYMMYGAEEADAFDEGRYNDLHKSTLSKVRLFYNFLRMVDDNQLIVSTPLYKSFGISLQVLYEIVKEQWWWALLTFFIGTLLGAIIGNFFQ